jgi:hypothetical protein
MRPPAWDAHAACFKHRDCASDNTCDVCSSWDKELWSKVKKAKNESSTKRKAPKRAAENDESDASGPKSSRQEGGAFNWNSMKDYFDKSMKDYVTNTVSSNIQTSVSPLVTQMQTMSETFNKFYTDINKSMADSKKAQPAEVPSTSEEPPKQSEEYETRDFIDVATDGYLSFNDDQDADLSDGEIPTDTDKESSEYQTFKVISDKGVIQFKVDISNPDLPKIPYKKRIEMMAQLAGEAFVPLPEAQLAPGAAHWFPKGSEASAQKSTLQVALQFGHQVQKSLDALKNLSRKKAFPKPPKPTAIAVVQDKWGSARIPSREFNKLCFSCHPILTT